MKVKWLKIKCKTRTLLLCIRMFCKQILYQSVLFPVHIVQSPIMYTCCKGPVINYGVGGPQLCQILWLQPYNSSGSTHSWCLDDFRMTLGWCTTSGWCQDDFRMMSGWLQNDVGMTSEWCQDDLRMTGDGVGLTSGWRWVDFRIIVKRLGLGLGTWDLGPGTWE